VDHLLAMIIGVRDRLKEKNKGVSIRREITLPRTKLEKRQKVRSSGQQVGRHVSCYCPINYMGRGTEKAGRTNYT